MHDPRYSSPLFRKARLTLCLVLLAATVSGCVGVDYGPVMSFDRRGQSPEAYRQAAKTCRYDVERMEFRSQRVDHGQRLYIACMEKKGFDFLGVRAVWIDRPCPEGTPKRKLDGTCREFRPYHGPPF
jgi:hypothetical protein